MRKLIGSIGFKVFMEPGKFELLLRLYKAERAWYGVLKTKHGLLEAYFGVMQESCRFVWGVGVQLCGFPEIPETLYILDGRFVSCLHEVDVALCMYRVHRLSMGL